MAAVGRGREPQFSLRATGAVARRQALSRASYWILMVTTLSALAVLFFLGYDSINVGWPRLNLDFITNYPSRFAEQAGLRSSLLGLAWVLGLTIVMAIPVAIGTAIWIEEFAPRNMFTKLIEVNIANLAGVPSIIYGILGLTVFVRSFGLGPSIIAGALVLSLMILPMIVIASQEAIRQVPPSITEGSLALGATKWQTVWHHVLPGAMPGIMTGTILAISRAAGETAALIMIGAFTFIAFDNRSIHDDFTTVPIQIYNWTIRPANQGFEHNAAAGIVVLMVIVITLNLVAVLIRERFRPR
ncbi:MAG: phosphate ABC transporter permease PstA [Dehalococcoidia bacterium]